MTALRLGSLCTGYGGLDLAAEHVLGPLEHTWHAEIDPHASKVLAHHWPTTPNLGDLTTVDWTAVADCPPDARELSRRVGDGAAGTDGVILLPTPAAARSGRQKSASAGAAIRPSLDSIGKLLPTPNAAQGRGTGTPSRETAHRRMYVENRRFLDDAIALLPTPTVADSRGTRNITATRADLKPTTSLGWTLGDVTYADRWGDYGAAIQRWEAATERPAPSPTEPGTRGQARLNAGFVEWLMGLPAGWVTDHLGRNSALKCLGNGVVWQQAAHAYTQLLGTA